MLLIVTSDPSDTVDSTDGRTCGGGLPSRGGPRSRRRQAHNDEGVSILGVTFTQLTGPRTVPAAVVVIALVSGGVGASPPPAAAATGAGTPVISSFAMSTTSLDVRTASKKLTLTLTAAETSDPVRGITSVQAELLSPSLSYQHPERSAWVSFTRTAGTSTSGTWVGSTVIPRWTIPGTWRLLLLRLTDKGGGLTQYSDGQTSSTSGEWTWNAAWPTTFTVQSVADITKPRLKSFTFSPRSVDTRKRVRSVPITVRAADSQSGVGDVYVVFEHTTKIPNGSSTIGYSTHLTKHGKLWKGALRVPMWVGSGIHTWHPYVRVFDKATNSRSYSTASLHGRSEPTSLRVRSLTDKDSPTLTALTTTPGSVDVASAAGAVAITARAADQSSGAQAARVIATSPSGTQATKKLVRAAGPRTHARFRGILTIPQGAEPGRWTLHATITDLVGHSRSYSANRLASLGLPSAITVTST